MTATKTYAQAGTPELMSWFMALHSDAFVSKGRDMHLLRRFLDDSGATPAQVLEGMLHAEGCRSIPLFIAQQDYWLLSDALAQEARLAVWLSDGDPPTCFYDYIDLQDTGVLSAEIEAHYRAAKQKLEQWVEQVLGQQALSPRHPAMRKKILARQERVSA